MATLLPPPSCLQSLVSGGVDSAVCTALLLAALGPEQVIAVHIDNGFMRKNESEEVKESLENLGLHPHSEHSQSVHLGAGITCLS